MEYALSNEEELQWTWLTYRNDQKIGTFQGLDKLIAITRTSRQVHWESQNMVWKFNTFKFYDGYFGDDYSDNFINIEGHSTHVGLRLAGSIHTCQIFLRSLSFTTFELVKSKIEFRVIFPSKSRNIVRCFQLISNLGNAHPGVVPKIKVFDWTVRARRRNGRMLVSADEVASFLLKGQELQDPLTRAGFDAKDRGLGVDIRKANFLFLVWPLMNFITPCLSDKEVGKDCVHHFNIHSKLCITLYPSSSLPGTICLHGRSLPPYSSSSSHPNHGSQIHSSIPSKPPLSIMVSTTISPHHTSPHHNHPNPNPNLARQST